MFRQSCSDNPIFRKLHVIYSLFPRANTNRISIAPFHLDHGAQQQEVRVWVRNTHQVCRNKAVSEHKGVTVFLSYFFYFGKKKNIYIKNWLIAWLVKLSILMILFIACWDHYGIQWHITVPIIIRYLIPSKCKFIQYHETSNASQIYWVVCTFLCNK